MPTAKILNFVGSLIIHNTQIQFIVNQLWSLQALQILIGHLHRTQFLCRHYKAVGAYSFEAKIEIFKNQKSKIRSVKTHNIFFWFLDKVQTFLDLRFVEDDNVLQVQKIAVLPTV